jgi:hypothetical protein
VSTLRRIVWVTLLFLVGGALAGVLWELLWEPTKGVTYQGTWYADPAGPDTTFSAIALYVVIALPLGLVLAVVAGIWRDREWATVATVAVASVAAGFLMYAVGHAMGPADPQALAAGAADYDDSLPGALGLSAPDHGQVQWHSAALLALPTGAMLGLVGTYLLGSRGLARRPRG